MGSSSGLITVVVVVMTLYNCVCLLLISLLSATKCRATNRITQDWFGQRPFCGGMKPDFHLCCVYDITCYFRSAAIVTRMFQNASTLITMKIVHLVEYLGNGVTDVDKSLKSY